jgi:hypothetical protein
MLAIASLLFIVALSIIVTRVATLALVHTGLSRETARFQARSALSGTGFTTSEAERVVRHPVRRRIVMILMLLGNAGLITAMSSLMLSFIGTEEAGDLLLNMLLLAGGLALLWLVASSAWVDRHLSHVIDRALRRYTRLEVQDYASVMHLGGEYRIVELQVAPGDWLANKTLAEARLQDEGITVLGIERTDGTYLGAPDGSTCIGPEDSLLVYGRISTLQDLDTRRATRRGDAQHRLAKRQTARIREQESAPGADRKDPQEGTRNP